jgi:cell division protein FtsI (penicillin-binding protein 3)
VAEVPGYLMGGKTGTAQRHDEDCGCQRLHREKLHRHGARRRPQIVVGAWFDNPSGSYYGGDVAAPVVQKLMTAALASQNVPPTGGKRAKFPLTWGGMP